MLKPAKNGPYVGILSTLKITLLVGFMSTNWSIFVQLHASVGALLAIADVCLSRLIKEDNMIRTIAQAIILTVGTALLGWPIYWRHVSNFSGESIP